jgi:tripartite-type tricarboxylate transporter receptor subunit TctC
VIANTLRRLAALGAALGASAVLAQTPPAFPLKPVRLIVPFAPGGANDIVARLVGARLGESWTQAVLIENRPGAGATLGMELVARAAPDGYTLGAGNQSSLVIGPLLNPKVAYDPQRDLAAIGSTAATPYVIAVNARVPLRSLADLLRLARAKPGFLSYGTAGSGTISHIATELLLDATGTRMLHVPYKGAGPYLTALITGEIDLALVALSAAEPFVRNGQLRLLASTGARRAETAPDLPTLAEGGVRIAAIEGRYGIVGPGALPRELVLRINAAIGQAVKSPDLRQRLLSQGFEPIIDRPEQYAAAIRAEIESIARVIRAAGLKADQ